MSEPRPHIRLRAYDQRFEVVAWRNVHEYPRWVCVDVCDTQDKAQRKLDALLAEWRYARAA